MKLAYIIFQDITWLDLIGVYDAVSRLKAYRFLPHLSWDICSFEENVKDSYGLEIKPTKIKTPLLGYDAIIIPGGYGTRNLVKEQNFIAWIQTARDVRYKISICTGSLILGAAGFLEGKKATTHFSEYETLKSYCKEVLKDKIVVDGDTITAGAVSSSINLGLYLCELWSGKEAREWIRQKMDFKE